MPACVWLCMCINNYNQGLFRPSADAISSLISVEFELKTVVQVRTGNLKSNKPQYPPLSGRKLPIIASEPTWRWNVSFTHNLFVMMSTACQWQQQCQRLWGRNVRPPGWVVTRQKKNVKIKWERKKRKRTKMLERQRHISAPEIPIIKSDSRNFSRTHFSCRIRGNRRAKWCPGGVLPLLTPLVGQRKDTCRALEMAACVAR